MINSYKKTIRTQVTKLDSSDLKQAAVKVAETLKGWEVYQQAESVAFYLSMDDEVSIDHLLKCPGKKFLPRFNTASRSYEMAQIEGSEDLVEGKYGILEPSPECRKAERCEIALWLIPAVSFDSSGNRLGRGGGFYDRLLEGEKGIKAGIAHSKRIVSELPVEEWDVKMNFIVTEKDIIIVN